MIQKYLNMKISYLLFFIFWYVINSFALIAQESNDHKISRIKLYLNGFYRYSEISNYATNDSGWKFKTEKYDFGFLSIAIELNRIGFFKHEIELMPFRFTNSNEIIQYFNNNRNAVDSLVNISDGGRLKKFETSFRYQINHCFNVDKSIVPYLSLAAQLHYDLSKHEPWNSFYSNITEQNIGLLFSIIPGISIKASKKLEIDFNIPIAFNDFRLNVTNFKNPLLTTSETKKSKFISEYMSNFINVRIGLVYRL